MTGSSWIFLNGAPHFSTHTSDPVADDSLDFLHKVEYIVVVYDDETKTVKLSLRSHDALEKLQEQEFAEIAAGYC